MVLDSDRRSRGVLLPYPGDPFLLNYWLNWYDRVWGKEVDRLYIFCNSPVEPEVAGYIFTRANESKNVLVYMENKQKEHGTVIKDGLQLVRNKYVMLVEDDAFIFKYGAVSQCFNMIESGAFDVVGSKRGSCGTEVYDAAMRLYGLQDTGLGDQGPNFWPSFFFAKRELLMKVDNFGAKAWDIGDKVPYLNYVVKDAPQASDTMVEASWQIRSMVPESRIHYVPQYHGHPDDRDHYIKGQYLFSGKAPWCHIGSLSSGIGGILQDDFSRPLSRRHLDKPGPTTRLNHKPTNDFEKREYERRVQWWLTFWEQRQRGKIDNFAHAYKLAIDRVIRQYNLSMERISERQQIYEEIMI